VQDDEKESNFISRGNVFDGWQHVCAGRANFWNVLFYLLFAAFAVRRFLIHQKFSGQSAGS